MKQRATSLALLLGCALRFSAVKAQYVDEKTGRSARRLSEEERKQLPPDDLEGLLRWNDAHYEANVLTVMSGGTLRRGGGRDLNEAPYERTERANGEERFARSKRAYYASRRSDERWRKIALGLFLSMCAMACYACAMYRRFAAFQEKMSRYLPLAMGYALFPDAPDEEAGADAGVEMR